MSEQITLYETTPRKNWTGGRMPGWVDERTRLYTGFRATVATREWTQMVVHFDGEHTTAYLTANGFDLEMHGPAAERMHGATAQYRKVVAKWFRESYGLEVTFA